MVYSPAETILKSKVWKTLCCEEKQWLNNIEQVLTFSNANSKHKVKFIFSEKATKFLPNLQSFFDFNIICNLS